MHRSFRVLALVLFCVSDILVAAELRVVKGAPTGEISKLSQANEIRVTFSEPMVTLGAIPPRVEAPFFRIDPKLQGTFRWAGTTTLVFTPASPLPYATKFSVTIGTSAVSAAGNRLAAPYDFTFTTPSVRLLSTISYRKGDRFDMPLVLALRFNQPVDPASILAALTLERAGRQWSVPVLPTDPLARLAKIDPASQADFEQKRAKAAETARGGGRVEARLAADWNKKRFPPSRDLVVVETTTPAEPGSTIEVIVGETVPSRDGRVTPGRRQQILLQSEQTFFTDGFECTKACDPEGYNPLRFRAAVAYREVSKTTRLFDITDPSSERQLVPTKAPEFSESMRSSYIDLDELGYRLEPARNYLVVVDRSLRALDGQTLGYTWAGTIENWHRPAFTSFGDGHGVWEASGGTALPYYARNLKSVTEWVAPLSIEGLMPAIGLLEERSFDLAPSTPPRARNLSPVPDKIQSYGLEMRDALTRVGLGLVWAAIREGQTIPKSSPREGPRIKASIVQVTNLGITIKDSPANTLIFVTRLDDAAPVAGAKVTIRTLDNKPFWSGQTDQHGLVKVPATPLRPFDEWWRLTFIVTAEKEGDVAYAASNWNEGILPWAFGLNFDLEEASPLLRGRVVTDRGVYKPGEEIHFKAVLRSDTAEGIRLFPPGTEVSVVVKDPRDREIDRRTIRLSEWSSAEWTFTLPVPGALGFHQIVTSVEGQTRELSNSFLVAAYRRPDFRVDVTLAGDPLVAGSALKGVIGGRYLYGAAMATRPVRWIYSKQPWNVVPPAIEERFPSERFTFLDEAWQVRQSIEQGTISQEEGALDAKGELPLNLPTLLSAGRPYQYTLEGEVTDITRQTIAGRASVVVHPAPWYVGVRTPPYFAETRSGLDTEVVAVTLDGKPAPGVAVEVTLTRVQWNSVRRAEGNGFYTWVTERKEIPAGKWDVVTGEAPAALHIDIKEGGSYILHARASDGAGRSTLASVSFYALGEGYTAWAREDHNRIELVPEKKKYKPGDTARILIKSPWEKATALVTTEREGVRSERQFSLDSTQQTVEVPITESDIPNVYVSVLLVKGRTRPATDEDTSDPGKPSFRLGYAELSVEDASKRLSVEVTANREEYRPKDKAVVSVKVRDHRGRGAKSEVTLWAVDYGVLSLTAYQTPDVLESVYIPKAISVLTEDSRQKIVSRRVLTPKGASDGGGGGVGEGSTAGVRKDFRVLAFWLGSLVTDGEGKARANVALPESLTTYRIMAIAGDKISRFGWGQREVRISKPLMLTPAFPRFLALGDKATFGSVVHSLSKVGGTAVVTMRSLDPSILEVSESEKKTIRIDGASSKEVRYELIARRLGTAKIRTTVTMGSESDAFEESVPVTLIAPTETVVASGEADPKAAETLELPGGVLRDVGGLRIELASTALVGLNEGARYLVEYPYGCAEQRASATLALMLASDLGGAFSIPGIEAAKVREKAQAAVRELETFQCSSGGFAFWPGLCDSPSPYLTSYAVHILQRAGSLGYAVSPAVLESAYAFLEGEMAAPPPTNEAWWPAYTAWESFVVKVLTKGGRNQDSNITRLYGYLDRMPVFALSYLFDALTTKGEKGARVAELRRRIENAILPEAATAHVEELSDPYLLWFWNSNIRSTAIVLGSLVRNTDDRATAEKLVRWLMRVREKGRWGNTQENALAMESLVDYYRKYEAEVPDFSAIVMLGGEILQKERFEGRTTDARVANKAMASLPSLPSLPLTFAKEGIGRLFYTARLTYARDELELGRLDRGFQVERSYSPMSGVGHGRAVPNPGKEAAFVFVAGDLVRVTLRFRLPKERRFVAVTDPLPAGFEPVESWFATTASDLARAQQDGERGARDWTDWFRRGGFDYVERRDDRVNLFATRLSEGAHEFSYVVRATTSGVFRAAPAHAEQMYEPEVFGRTETTRITVE